MPTIGDVAAKANVSTATVSRALNGKSSVDPELARRVHSAAKELGYQPHGPARNLRRRATATLSLVIADVATPRQASIARGFEDIAQANGYSVVLGNTDGDPERERRYLDVAVRELAAGVALSPAGAATDVGGLLERGTPVVAIDLPLADPACDSVRVDVERAAATATRHLLDNGCRRIGFITDAAVPAAPYLAGYGAALAGSAANRLVAAAADAADAHRTVDALLHHPDPPDGLVIATAALAHGALGCLAERGMRLGSDIGVIACEDADWMSAVRPAVSAVAYPAYQIGKIAAELVLSGITNDRNASHIRLEPELLRGINSPERNYTYSR